jgi:fibronectin type 3 domain-containing protein
VGGDSAFSNIANVSTSVPAAPSDLRITATTTSSLTLEWNDNADNELAFAVERTTVSAPSDFVPVAQLAQNVTAWVDTDLKAGEVYLYRVTAHNNAGDSSYSNTVQGAPQ